MLTISILKKNNENIHISILLFTWHLLLAYIHYYYSLFFNYASDSYNYYYETFNNPVSNWFSLNLLAIGSNFLKNLVFLFNKVFLLSYFNVFLIFSVVGNFGVIYLYLILRKLSSERFFIIVFSIILIPSMGFWTSSISKDVITFFASNYFLWNLIKTKKLDLKVTFLSFFLIFLVRPHISLIFLISILFGLLIKNKKNIYDYFFLSIFTISIPYILSEIKKVTGYSLDFSSLNNFFNSLLDLVKYRQELNVNLDAVLDYSTINPFEKLFAYYYRPLPIDANSALQLIISLENSYLLFLSILLIINILLRIHSKKLSILSSNRKIDYKFIIVITYAVLLSLLLSQITSNFGISSRQKYMVIPFIYFAIFYFISNKNLKIESNTK